jgi:hypothetical protein
VLLGDSFDVVVIGIKDEGGILEIVIPGPRSWGAKAASWNAIEPAKSDAAIVT